MDAGWERYDEIDRVSKHIVTHLFDYTEAIAMVVDVMPNYVHEEHKLWAPRKFFRHFCPNEFNKIKNARAAVEAYLFLKEEKRNESQGSAGEAVFEEGAHAYVGHTHVPLEKLVATNSLMDGFVLSDNAVRSIVGMGAIREGGFS